jgi:mediator of RNA polymerase II transcription subunit 12
VRSYLESFGDLAILADIIGIVATSLDSNVLSAAADTLSYHVEAFRAIGAFEPLFEKIAMRFAAIRTVQFPERDLLISLTDLARLAHADPQLLHLLSYDLSRYDQRNSLAACSPASDSMADNLLALDIEDEIERILSSGTSMDQQMMGRVFGKVTTNLEEQLCKGSCQVENFSTWLYRLRTFEESTFDMIMASWLGSLLLNHQAQLLSAALPPLISSGCLTLRRFLKTLQECINSRQSSHPEESLRIAVEGLDRLLPYERNQSPCRQYDMYRYRLEQYKLCRQRDSGLLGFLGDIIMLESVKHNLEPDRQLLDLCSSDRLLSALRHFIIQDVRSVSGLISAHQQGSQETQLSCSTLLSSRLLDPLNKMRKLLPSSVSLVP